MNRSIRQMLNRHYVNRVLFAQIEPVKRLILLTLFFFSQQVKANQFKTQNIAQVRAMVAWR